METVGFDCAADYSRKPDCISISQFLVETASRGAAHCSLRHRRGRLAWPRMVSQKTWSPEAAARLFIAVLLTLLFGMLLASLVESFRSSKSPWPGDRIDFIEIILMVVFFQISILFWALRFLAVNHLSWRESFFAGRRTWRALALGLGVGVLAVMPLDWMQTGISELAEKVFGFHLAPQDVVEKLGSPTLPLATKIFTGFSTIVLAPLSEEILFRGLLYPTAKQSGYPRMALWGTSLLFGLSHATAMAFVPLTFLAMVLVWLYEVTDNLMTPIAAHCAFNAVNYSWIIYSGLHAAGAH